MLPSATHSREWSKDGTFLNNTMHRTITTSFTISTSTWKRFPLSAPGTGLTGPCLQTSSARRTITSRIPLPRKSWTNFLNRSIHLSKKHSTFHAPLRRGINGTLPIFGTRTGCSTYLIESTHIINGNAALPRPTILTSLNGSSVHTRKNVASEGDDHGVPIWAPHRARRRLHASCGP